MKILAHTPYGMFESKEYVNENEAIEAVSILNKCLDTQETLLYYEMEMFHNTSLVLNNEMFSKTIFQIVRMNQE